MKKVELFSDGSCLNNPGTGGWAYILKCEGSVKKDCGAQAETTNNKMEITAALNGLKALNQKCEVELFTDSQYVQKGINEWLEGWAKKNYNGVKNPDLWREMKAMCETHKVRAHWVKGHAGHPENEECDEAAREAATRLEGQIKGKTVSNLNAGAELGEEDKKLFKFESLLGYEFKDKALLREALTHKSFKANFSNERLEFLGDAVLDLIVGEYLYHKIKGANNEGNLSKLRAALVNEDSFAKIAARIGLGGFIFMSGAEERNGGREKPSLTSDALEAVMGAMYLESGLEKVKRVFLRLLESEYPNINLKTLGKDFKTSLQEFTQAKFGVTPRYELVGASGPDHKKTFEMALFIGESLRATASGASKKDAEQKAAQIVLKEYNLLSKDEK